MGSHQIAFSFLYLDMAYIKAYKSRAGCLDSLSLDKVSEDPNVRYMQSG